MACEATLGTATHLDCDTHNICNFVDVVCRPAREVA